MDASEIQSDFLQSYEVYADAIFRHCYFRLRSREVAQDLMQDTFMRSWDYLRKNNTVENMRAFLYRIANNLIIDYVRKKKEESLEQKMEEGFQPAMAATPLNEMIDAQAILKILHKVQPEFRTVIIMRYIDDLSPKEIAEALNESPNIISVRLNRALEKVRSLLPPV